MHWLFSEQFIKNKLNIFYLNIPKNNYMRINGFGASLLINKGETSYKIN